MARIMLYDSGAVLDSSGNEINNGLPWGFSTDADNPIFSKPVRLFSIHGEERVLGIELLYDGADTVDFTWWMSYWYDKPQLGFNRFPNAPTDQTAYNLPQQPPTNSVRWAREVTEEVAAGGAITHSFVSRTVTLGASALTRHVTMPLAIHAYWAMVAISAGSTPAGRLYVFGNVGGHSEAAFVEANQAPYIYTAEDLSGAGGS